MSALMEMSTTYDTPLRTALERLGPHDHQSLILCQYNRQLLPPEYILKVIHTHPTAIYRDVVCRNMYHVPPDEFLSTNQTAREVERLLMTIRERAEIEYTLWQQGHELRMLASRLMHAQE